MEGFVEVTLKSQEANELAQMVLGVNIPKNIHAKFIMVRKKHLLFAFKRHSNMQYEVCTLNAKDTLQSII